MPTSTVTTSQNGARYATGNPGDPHIAFADASRRGWLELRLTPEGASAEMRAVADAADRDSPATTHRRFMVEQHQPRLHAG